LAKWSYNFMWLKKLNLQLILLYLRYTWGLVKNVIWGRGLAENIRIPSYRGEGI